MDVHIDIINRHDTTVSHSTRGLYTIEYKVARILSTGVCYYKYTGVCLVGKKCKVFHFIVNYRIFYFSSPDETTKHVKIS